jgi:hypothetical protein
MEMDLEDIDSISFTHEKPEDCYKDYYTWDTNRVKRTKHKTNIIDKFLYFSNAYTPYTYTLVVIYFEED